MRKKHHNALLREHAKLSSMVDEVIKNGSFALNRESILKQSRKVDKLLIKHAYPKQRQLY